MKEKRRVTVLGGGIAGLTAAHELVERGFEVSVIEKHRQVGGMARTQWCTRGSFWLKGLGEESVLDPAQPIAGPGPSLDFLSDTTITFKAGWDLESAQADVDAAISKLMEYYESWIRSPPADSGLTGFVEHRVAVEGFALRSEETGPEPDFEELVRHLEKLRPHSDDTTEIRPAWDRAGSAGARWALGRTLLAKAALYEALFGRQPRWPEGRNQDLNFVFEAVPLARFGPSASDGLPEVSLRLLSTQIPGEHGYRYFPGFYRHVFDSMRRTPLFEERRLTPSEAARADDPDTFWPPPIAEVESARTVMDNVVPTLRFAIAPGDKAEALRIARVSPRSVLEVRRLLRSAFEDMKIELEDLVRFEEKILRFLTSCPARRATYEGQTWWSFLGADRMSEEMQVLVERWPQALIGLRAREADARTIGTITVQLLLEQLSASGFRDGTLNGPTSSAWLEPWRRYLERMGVTFVTGEVESLRLGKDGVEFRVKGTAGPEGGGEESETRSRKEKSSRPRPLVVLAVSVMEAQRLVRCLWESLSAEEREELPEPFAALLCWPEGVPERGGLPVGADPPGGPLRHYSGIQFYLENDLGPPEGHIYFASSDYRLSAISQAQFWRQRLVDEDDNLRVVSVLSVDIGDWHSPSRATGRSAAQSTRAELAGEVWRQIEDGLSDRAWSPPMPVAYHVDDDVVYGAASREEGKGHERKAVRRELPLKNEAPYLVNLAGDWEKRPGAGHRHMGYEVYKGLVLAGSYMRTHTRLATMEAANESGRRAVNAILRHLRCEHPKERFPKDCMTWNPEESEVDDLDPAKRIDQDLFEAGLPHAFDILGVESLVDIEEPRGAPGEAGRTPTLAEVLLSRAVKPLDGAVGAALLGDLGRLVDLLLGKR